MAIVKTKWLVTESKWWRSELNGWRSVLKSRWSNQYRWRSKLNRWLWRGPLEGGWRSTTPSGLWRSDRLQRHLRRWHMLLVDWSVSWIEVPLRLPCTPSIKTSTSPSFLLLCAETTLSERVRHLSELTHSHPSATTLTRSLLSLVSDPIRSLRYTFSFYTCHGRSIKFLASVSSLFFFFILDCQS